MCLSKISIKKIAEEDIICYKIVLKTGTNQYETPFQCMKVSLNTEYVDTTPTNDNLVDLSVNEINGGYYHSFKNKDNVLEYSHHFNGAVCVLKGIIPKGSEYYEGVYTSICIGYLPAYASKKIKYIEEIV